MYGLHRRPQWRWSLSLLSVVCAWLLVSTPPAALGFFMGDTKAVLNGCNDRWTLQDTVSMPLLYHMTVCVDVRVVIPGPWVAFSYSSVHALKPELGLEGDSQALYAWLLRVRHRFPVSLSPFQWHRVCLKRDVHGNTFSLQVDQALVAKRTVIAQAIPPSGSLWLGCRPRDKVRGAVLGKVEVYMFRMWPDLKDHGLCEDGSVIRWNAHYWGLTSPRAREMDPQLMCDHRRLKRDVRAKRSAAAIPTGFRRLFSPPPMPHTTTIAGPVMRTSAAAVTASSRTISSGSATSLSASARTSRTTNTGQHLESLATPSRTTSPASTPSRALISPTPASTASSSDVSRYSSASQTVAMATHDSHSVTTLSAMLTTPADSRTSAAPLSSCDFSQLCSGENAYFWMWLNVSAQEDGTTERQVHDMVSGAFRCDEDPSAASELCARNIQPEVSEVNCNHAANISRTHCGVLLELSRAVATCELRRVAASVLQRAGSDGLRATIVGEVERVGRSQCEGAASSSGRFVRCTSSSTLEEVCRANQYSSLSCSLFDPNSVAESTADAESCSGEAPQLCDCAAFCNSTNQFYATRLEVTSAAVTADLLRTLLSTRPCDTASECQSYLHIYQVYKDVHLECHGTEDRLYSCMVIMETSGAVDGCLFSELVQRLVDSQENITTELPLTRLVVCGSPESTVADLLASNLTWSASDQLISDVCPPEPTLFHCSANQSLAVLLSQSCPSTPVTPTTMTPSTTTEPATTSASQTADYKTPGPTNTPEFPAYTTDVTISSNTTDSAVSAPKTSTSSVNKTTVSNSGMTETFTLTQNDTTTNPTTEDAMWSTLDILDNTSTEMNPTSSATSASTTNPATFATSFPAIMSTLSVTTEDAATTAVFATVTAPYTTSVPPESTTFATSTAATTSATTAESTFASATATAIATPSTTIGFETQYTMASETTDSYGDATDNATSDTSMMITNPTDSTQTTVSGTETQTFFTSLDNTTEHVSSSESVSTTANNVAHQTITLTPNNTTYNATSFATVTANRSSTTLTYSTTSSLAADTTLFNTTAATNQTAVGNTTIANDSRSLLNGTSSNVTTTSPTTTHTPGFDWTTAVEATTSAGPSLNTTTVATAGPNMETQQNATGFFKNTTTTTQSSETVNMAAGTTDAPPTNQTATDSTAGVGGNTNVTTNMTSNMRTTSTSAPDLTVSTTRSTRNTTAKGNLADNSTAASQTTADGVGPSVHATTAINSRSTAGSRINATTVSVTQNQASAEQQIDELLSQTQDASRLNSSQVDLVVSQLEKILEAESISKESAQKAINVVSNLMQADASALAPSANRIVKVVEQVGLKLSVEGRSEIISSELLVQLVQLVDGTNFQATSVDIISTDNVQTTALSRSLSRTSDPPAGSVFLPSSLTDGLSPEQQLQASRVQFTFYTKPVLFQDQTLNNQTVVSPVLATSVSNLSISNLKENIRFTIRHTDPQHTNFEASCVFWDFSLHGGSGGWSSDGCSVLNSSAEETVCGCSHLTSFAILLDLSRGEITDRQQAEILTFITYIGCGISAIFLAVTLLTYLSFEKLLRDIPAKILVQLCTALFFLNMVYLLDGWLALYTAPGLCISTGFFLHYFLLSAFTWTGLEALHMYLSIVQVFTPYLSRYMLKFSLMGWGFPLIVVVIIIAVDKDNYGLVTYGRFNDGTTNDFCWLRNDIAFYVGVVTYFLLIFVVCVIVFIVVMVQLSRIKRQNPQNQSPNRGLMADVRSIAGLVVLLGLTWGFALFAWGPLYLPFVYLFSIFNSLQGFFIFIFHCAYKENVRRQWRTYLCCGRLRLAENSDWSRTATQNTRHLSTGTATTSLHHLTSRSSSVASDSTNSSGSVFVDSGISDTSHSDVVLNEIHRRNLTHQFQV